MQLRKLASILCLWSMLLTTLLPGFGPAASAESADGAAGGYLVDELADWSKTFSHSPSLTIQTSAGSPDPSRVQRSAAASESFVYKTDFPIRSFSVSAYFNPSGKPYEHVVFSVSSDGAVYTPVAPDAIDLGGYPQAYAYELPTLPANTHYLKIQFRGSQVVKSPSIGKVVLNGPASVAPSLPAGIVDEGAPLLLTGGSAGAAIFYTTDGSDPRSSATRQRYAAPIPVNGSFVLKAYSEVEGVDGLTSHVSVYRYIAKRAGDALLPAVQDAMVDSGSPDANYGTVSSLFVKALRSREAYFKFDLSSVGDPIDRVTFHVYGYAQDPSLAPAKLRVYGVSDGWTESTLTFANKPLPKPIPSGTELDEVVLNYERPGWLEFDVTDYVKRQKWAGQSTVALALANTTDGGTTLNSREAGTDAPFLKVTPSDSTVPIGMVDPLDDFSRVDSRSNARIEMADAAYFGGDAKRMTRNTTEPGYLIYKTPYELKSFAVGAYFLTSLAVNHPAFYASADGGEYVQVTPSIYRSGKPVANWQQFVYESFDLPPGMRYLKIEVKGTDKAWTPQLSKAALNVNVASVKAGPETGTIGDAPLTVTLSSDTAGAQIFYKTAEDPEYKPYAGPLSLTGYTELETYAAKAGMEPSAAKTYTYYSRADLAVDTFGQVFSANFPEKVTNEQQLRDDVAADEAYYGAITAPDWDAYGGLKGSRESYGLEAKGFYSVQSAGGRTVMATPDGNAFFSVGINGIQPNDSYTMVTGREHVFEWLPDYNSEYKSAFLNSKDYFSFYLANRIKKYGEPYNSRAFYADSLERLKKWGFNSAGGWSPTPSAVEFQVPYVPFLPLNDMQWAKVPGLKIFDIFADGAEQKLDEAFARALPPNKDNKLIIGYFLGNEYHYHEFIAKVPKLKASEAAVKRRFVDMLKETYVTPEALNTAWNASFAGFDDMYEAPLYIDTPQAQSDIESFMKLYLDTFYGTVARVFRKYDPNHLLLGDRWLTTPTNNAKLRGFLAEAAGRYMDVISINHYALNLDKTMLRHVHEASGGKPVMLTEWGFGTKEQGLTAPIVVADQNERGLRYRNYVEGAASLGFVVGAHWFTYLDQAATGRWSEGYTGEKYNFGLVNVADRPYKTFLEGVMATNHDIYSVALGLRPPFYRDFGDAPREPGNRTIDIPYTAAPIPIDGEVNGFPAEARKTSLTAANRVGGAGGETITADYYFAWDETNLYVTAHVYEPTPMLNQYRNANIWKGDGVELFVGPNDLTTHGPLLFYDSQVILSAALADGEPYWHWFNTSRQKPLRMAVRAAPNGQGYVLEAAISWESLNVAPADGTAFRFDFGFDDSEDGLNRKRQFVWNGTSSNATNRGLWGKATLVRAADTEAPVIAVSGVTEGGSYTDSVVPAVAADDPASGLKELAVKLDGADWASGTPVTAKGAHTLVATATDRAGNAATRTVAFTVYASTSLSVEDAAGTYSDWTTLRARLRDRDGAPIAGGKVDFRVDGAAAGSAVTDAAGQASLAYRVAAGADAGESGGGSGGQP
ncbi:CBM96 family carbohydrate-binding protein, partial [Paenibacillus sp. GYB003]|uniref:CBM96 family carbohydrate-binding protein n=1 Tax=Paenibacillus sp. GYB003 TaxID=2994392 RepID=UPI002F96BDA3